MANLLETTTQVRLNPQEQMSLLLAQQASKQASTQAAIDRKSQAFKKVVAEVETSKEDAERYREKARYLELDVSRTDAYLAKTRQLLTEEQKMTAKLRAELANARSGGNVCDKCQHGPDKEGDRTSKSLQHETSFNPTRETKKAHRQLLEEQEEDVKVFQPKPCISYEHHEIIIQQAMKMKQELTKLAKQNGQDVDKILEAAEYQEIIKKLQQDIQEKADENEQLLERIEHLCSEDDGPASQVVELQFKNEKLQKRLNISQFMTDTLSTRFEELKAEAERSGQPQTKQEGLAVHASIALIQIDGEIKTDSSEEAQSLSKGKDMVDGGVSLEQYEQQKQRLEKEIQLLDDQLKQVSTDNKQLFKERCEAEKQREIYEQRYNKLMETLQDVQQRQRHCSNCRSLEQELAKLRREHTDLKDIEELIRAQMKLYEEDLRQEQADSASLKMKSNFQIEQWKKNCQRMGQQVDFLTDDLQKERDENKRLKHQLGLLRSSGSRPALSMAPTFTRRCAPRGPKSTPWQEGYRYDDLECDGPGRDEPDTSDVSDSMGEFHSTSSTLVQPGGAPSQSMRSSFSLGLKPLECPRCKREYPPDRLDDFQRHVNKCIDSS